jgi:hypothetical protein
MIEVFNIFNHVNYGSHDDVQQRRQLRPPFNGAMAHQPRILQLHSISVLTDRVPTKGGGEMQFFPPPSLRSVTPHQSLIASIRRGPSA